MLKSAIVAALGLVAFGTGASAEPVYGLRDNILNQLSRKYQEVPVGIGLTENGDLLEMLSSSAGTAWTLIVTTEENRTCLIASGHDWETRQLTTAKGPHI